MVSGARITQFATGLNGSPHNFVIHTQCTEFLCRIGCCVNPGLNAAEFVARSAGAGRRSALVVKEINGKPNPQVVEERAGETGQ